MKTPVAIVTLALTVAILLTASLLIATTTRGDNVAWPPADHAPGPVVSGASAAK